MLCLWVILIKHEFGWDPWTNGQGIVGGWMGNISRNILTKVKKVSSLNASLLNYNIMLALNAH